MRLCIIGGFLGSGKTTVVLQILQYIIAHKKEMGSKIVVLENEVGKVSVDDQLIASTGVRVKTMLAGCVCCTMSGELIANLQYVQEKFAPDLVILETTGMAYPYKVQELLGEKYPKDICQLVCVVDAKRWERFQNAPPLKQFSEEQLIKADFILINKCDLITEEEKERIKKGIYKLNCTAEIFALSAKEKIKEDIWKRILMNE